MIIAASMRTDIPAFYSFGKKGIVIRPSQRKDVSRFWRAFPYLA